VGPPTLVNVLVFGSNLVIFSGNERHVQGLFRPSWAFRCDKYATTCGSRVCCDDGFVCMKAFFQQTRDLRFAGRLSQRNTQDVRKFP
jgi:hypothetical protein